MTRLDRSGRGGAGKNSRGGQGFHPKNMKIGQGAGRPSARMAEKTTRAIAQGSMFGLLCLVLALALPLSPVAAWAWPVNQAVEQPSGKVQPSSQAEAPAATKASPESVSGLPSATAGHPPVQVIPVVRPSEKMLAGRKKSYSFKVGPGDWMDTGVPVKPGDKLEFTASGSMLLSDGRSATPDGLQRDWRDLLRIFPLNSGNTGALVGRIGNDAAAVPFTIGATKSVDIAASGDLFLRANLSAELSGSGGFEVKMKLSELKEPKGKPAASALDLGKILSPAIFDKIPRRVHDLQDNPGDMVNFALLGTEEQVKAAFAAAGWVAVDRTTSDAVLHGLLATLSRGSYTAMPMSTLYLFGRPQDLSYARAEPLQVAFKRHHLRVWKSPETVDGKQLWVGSATHDNGLEKDQRNGGVTHHIDPDIDQERDFIEQSFAAAGVLASAAYVLPNDPVTSSKTATGGSFHTDGRVVVLDLK